MKEGKKAKLQTQPYKGARDFYPQDMRVRNYIFATWKKVCLSYGYEEYDGPFLEPFEIYAAKSGEELVNEQLYSFTDRGGRVVAIRPETTPTLARMVAQQYKQLARPIRWFTIQNMWRYEKPQRGRLREFFQLNFDLFGPSGIEADFEIVSLAIDIMLAFGASAQMFEIKLGNRKLTDAVLEKLGVSADKKKTVRKLIDKSPKISPDELTEFLKTDGGLSQDQAKRVKEYLQDPQNMVKALLEEGSEGAKEVTDLLNLATAFGKNQFIKFDPAIVRGLDYYTGNVFEQFDKNPQNTRAMYGGGRYDTLVEEFVNEKLPGVGAAVGDVTMLNFLTDWQLLPSFPTLTSYLVTLWPAENPADRQKFLELTLRTAEKLRADGKIVETWLESNTKLEKQLKYADKKGIENVVIIGPEELAKNELIVKNMRNGEQSTLVLASR